MANFIRLKTDPDPFRRMWRGQKKADLRDMSQPNTRGIEVGTMIWFEEFDRSTQAYSGNVLAVKVTDIQRGYILPEYGGMISFSILKRISQYSKGWGDFHDDAI